jgi:hypothetical protein
MEPALRRPRHQKTTLGVRPQRKKGWKMALELKQLAEENAVQGQNHRVAASCRQSRLIQQQALQSRVFFFAPNEHHT